MIELITAPSSLGLRPISPGHEPGAWRAPDALLSAGLASRLDVASVVELDHPTYEFEPQPGTRIRNGHTIRSYSLILADAVGAAFDASRFPVVLGGDCSVLLGCLVAARRAGRCGLLHVDGHSDFFHPANYDTGQHLGSVAGMDLAIATGRGEELLTDWPGVRRPLVHDDDVVQLGDREAEAAPADDSWAAVLDTTIAQLTVDQILRLGVAATAERVVEKLEARGLLRTWLHVDLDVLDQKVMAAVDSPGSPGLDYAQLADLLARLVSTRRVIGIDVTIYDPELDEERRHPAAIVECLASIRKAVS